MNVITDNSAFLKLTEYYYRQFCFFKITDVNTDNSAFLKLTECYYRQFCIPKVNWKLLQTILYF